MLLITGLSAGLAWEATPSSCFDENEGHQCLLLPLGEQGIFARRACSDNNSAEWVVWTEEEKKYCRDLQVLLLNESVIDEARTSHQLV